MSVTCSARVPVGPGSCESGVVQDRCVERRSLAQGRSSFSSKETNEETSPVVALRYAPTAAVRRARSAR